MLNDACAHAMPWLSACLTHRVLHGLADQAQEAGVTDVEVVAYAELVPPVLERPRTLLFMWVLSKATN